MAEIIPIGLPSEVRKNVGAMTDPGKDVRQLFNEALKLKPEDRIAFLENACGGHDRIRQEVESLLKADALAENFMESPAVRDPQTHALSPSSPLTTLDSWRLSTDERYQVAGEYARGGLGRILEAHDRNLHRTVALKELLTRDNSSEARFMREAYVTARLQHPAIVPVYEVGHWTDGKPFYAMKMVSGRSLSQVMKEKHSLNERLALLPHVIAVADAIAYAHQQRIIHRDLKPSNILIGPFGETVVVDWGLAADLNQSNRRSDPPSNPYQTVASELTVDGSVLGTPEYMSPEQAQGKRVDPRTDVYAIGAMLYQLVVGVPPFQGKSSNEVIAKVITQQPQPLETSKTGVPTELAAIIQKALSSDPDKRYPTAKELAEDLKRFTTGQLVTAYSYSTFLLLKKWARRYRLPLAMAAVFLLVISVISVLSVRRIIRERDRSEQQRVIAREQQAIAERQRAIAEHRNNELRLEKAHALLETDPTKVLAWLKTFQSIEQDRTAVRELAADALSRGIARHVLNHEGEVTALTFSPDGKTLATASEDKTVRLWDLATGKSLGRDEHEQGVRTLAFSANGEWLASAGYAGTIRLWKIGTDEKRLLRGHRGTVWSLAFSPHANQLASAGDDGEVRVWSIPTGAVQIFKGHRQQVTSIAFLPDGETVISAGADKTVRQWNLANGKGDTIAIHRDSVLALSVSPSGRWVASAGKDSQIKLWGTKTRRSVTLRGHQDTISCLSFSPDEKTLASSSSDSTVRVWDLTTNASFALFGHNKRVMRVTFSPNGKLLASTGSDKSVRVWETATRQSRVFLGHRGSVSRVAFSPDGKSLATGGFDRTVRVWDIETSDSQALTGHTKIVHRISFSHENTQLASGGADNTVRLWDLATGKLKTFTVSAPMGGLAANSGPGDAVTRVFFSSHDNYLAASNQGQTIRIWNLVTGEDVRILVGDSKVVHALCFSEDESSLISTGDDNKLRIWNTITGKEDGSRAYESGISAVTCSPDGKWIASAGRDNAVYLWSRETGETQVLKRHQGSIFGLTFSQDSEWIVAAARDGSLRIWNRKSGQSTALIGHEGPVRQLAFSGDNKYLASGGIDKTVRVWRTDSGSVRIFRGHEAPVNGVSFSADRRLLASASEDNAVRIWDPDTGIARILRGHSNYVSTVLFSPSGHYLASSSYDGTIRLWPFEYGALPKDSADLSKWLNHVTTLVLSEQETW